MTESQQAVETAIMIAPEAVPVVILPTGARLPKIGLGTFGNDRYSPNQIAEAVGYALSIGYRHIDCASVYGNEDAIGIVLEQAMRNGILRRDLWITSKLWNDKHAEEDVLPSCEKTLRDLRLDYLDLYLIHWPFPNFHAKGVDVSSRIRTSRSRSSLISWSGTTSFRSGFLQSAHPAGRNVTGPPRIRLILKIR